MEILTCQVATIHLATRNETKLKILSKHGHLCRQTYSPENLAIKSAVISVAKSTVKFVAESGLNPPDKSVAKFFENSTNKSAENSAGKLVALRYNNLPNEFRIAKCR